MCILCGHVTEIQGSKRATFNTSATESSNNSVISCVKEVKSTEIMNHKHAIAFLLFAALCIFFFSSFITMMSHNARTDLTSDVDTSLGKIFQNPAEQESRITEEQRHILQKAGAEIRRQIPNYSEYKHLLLENGGSPIVGLLVTSWRSGSKFAGNFLQSHPGSFYHYEPLFHLTDVIRNEGVESASAVATLKNLMRCQYKYVSTAFMKILENKTHSFNRLLSRACAPNKEKYCADRYFLTKLCSLHPFQVIKTVRMITNLTKPLLRHSKRLSVVTLVRDPRGIMQSRSNLSWCEGRLDCSEQRLCRDLVSDFYAVQGVCKLGVDSPCNRVHRKGVHKNGESPNQT